MGRVARVLTFFRDALVSVVGADPGGGATARGQHFAPAGDDSVPLTGDYVLLVPTQRTGEYAAAGYLDPVVAAIASAGDKRIYARNPETGQLVGSVWLKNTGEVLVSNLLGTLKIAAGGAIQASNLIGTVSLSELGRISLANALGSFVIEPTGQASLTAPAIALNGPVTITGGLTVTGAATINGLLTAMAGANVTGNMVATGDLQGANATIAGTLRTGVAIIGGSNYSTHTHIVTAFGSPSTPPA